MQKIGEAVAAKSKESEGEKKEGDETIHDAEYKEKEEGGDEKKD